ASDAFFSFLPQVWLPYKLEAAMVGVIILILLNLRGVRESVLPLVPVFMTFIITHIIAIAYSLIHNAGEIPGVASQTVSDVATITSQVGIFGLLFILLRAFSYGAGTFTGIEAVSNGLPILREPKVRTARRTMRYMSISLATTVVGLMVAYLLFKVIPEQGKTLNAVLFESLTSGWPGDSGTIFVLITLLSEAALLFIAAQAGFLDGPRVLSNMAQDRWFPKRFTNLSDRFVTQNGVLLMGGAALAVMLLTGGSVRLLVVLYSINVFITFVLSQMGMVRHWWQVRRTESRWIRRISINAVGMTVTLIILVSVIIMKFHEGGWVTLLATGGLVLLAVYIKKNYRQTLEQLGRLDDLVKAAALSGSDPVPPAQPSDTPQPGSKTAIILVNGFNGVGLHTLFNVIKLFGNRYQNYIFVQIGILDAGNFKGISEVERLEGQVREDLDRYVEYMKAHGYYAEGVSSTGHDAVEEISKLVPMILERHPDAVVFGGQLVFGKDTFFARLLHNYTVFAIQRRFYSMGIPVVLLPIRV
ncbi:MAG: APC family permease, partial [candidate division Zixibacteria bacterium]|nr:APC family permease [candidate division Zixibacteria bacterium]